MATNIFVNLPVSNLDASVKFFTALGFAFNPQFTDETATCMIVSDTIYVMLLTREKFAGFTPRPVADAKAVTEVLIGLSRDSKADVDDLVGKALAAGGSEPREPNDYGFMFQRVFADPDGHIWEIFWMDPGFVQPA
jgi:uncharacterized protein